MNRWTHIVTHKQNVPVFHNINDFNKEKEKNEIRNIKSINKNKNSRLQSYNEIFPLHKLPPTLYISVIFPFDHICKFV